MVCARKMCDRDVFVDNLDLMETVVLVLKADNKASASHSCVCMSQYGRNNGRRKDAAMHCFLRYRFMLNFDSRVSPTELLLDTQKVIIHKFLPVLRF